MNVEDDLEGLPAWLIVCNCAGCGRLLTARACQHVDGRPPLLAGKIQGRPYCSTCLEVSLTARGRADGGRRLGREPEEGNPVQEGAVRELEGG